MITQTVLLAGIGLILLFPFPSTAEAEINLCNRQWTNKPCDSPAKVTLDEKPLDPKVANRDWPQKRDLVRTIKERIESLNRFGGGMEPTPVFDYCHSAEVSLIQCRAAVSKFIDEHSADIIAAETEWKRQVDHAQLVSRLQSAEEASRDAESAAISAERAAVNAQWAADDAARQARGAQQSYENLSNALGW
jgi:hypothetical protein